MLPGLSGTGLGMRCIDRQTPDQSLWKTTNHCGRYARREEGGLNYGGFLRGHARQGEPAGGGGSQKELPDGGEKKT